MLHVVCEPAPAPDLSVTYMLGSGRAGPGILIGVENEMGTDPGQAIHGPVLLEKQAINQFRDIPYSCGRFLAPASTPLALCSKWGLLVRAE